jgi:hypothetical protein
MAAILPVLPVQVESDPVQRTRAWDQLNEMQREDVLDKFEELFPQRYRAALESYRRFPRLTQPDEKRLREIIAEQLLEELSREALQVDV